CAAELESQEADAQLALAHEAAAHEAESQDASAQEAESHEALAHEAFAFAVEAQLAVSKTGAPEVSETMNLLSALFAVGGEANSTERAALTSPTPSERSLAFGIGFAPSINAPLTWSGVKAGCLPRISAATPLTTGAAKDVPESSM